MRSHQLNKVVVPRLSNAHNYSANALPVYHFFCDLQHQAKRTNITFHWGTIAKQYKFLPRMVYQNTILEQATWQLTKAEIDDVLLGKPLASVPSFTDRLMVLADGDNELLIDWQQPLSLKSFKDAIKNKEQIVLKEFLYEKEESFAINNSNRQGHLNQFIALLTKQKSSYNRLAPRTGSATRSFSVGSEWLYFKLYGGVKVADKILLECIKPLVEQLLGQNLMDKWFFIRYSDPDNHLRVRFHLPDTSRIGEIIAIVYQYLQPAQDTNYLWKVQIDTYNRELERYGFDTIALAEDLFFYR